MKGLKISCPSCKKVRWETTEAYDPDVTPNGSMVRLLQPWLGNSWPIFGDGVMPTKNGTGTIGTLCAEMDCIECLASLAPSGRLTVEEMMPVTPMEVGIPGVEDEVTTDPVPESEPEPESAEVEEEVEFDPLLRFKCDFCEEKFRSKHRKFVHETKMHA